MKWFAVFTVVLILLSACNRRSDLPMETQVSFADTSDINAGTSNYEAENIVVAIPGMRTVFVNGAHFSMPSYLIGYEHYFCLRDLAYVLNDTIARFSLSFSNPPEQWLRRGDRYISTGAELQELPRETKTAVPLAFRLIDMNWLVGGSFGTQAELDGFDIDDRLYVNLRSMGRALGFDVIGGVHTNFTHINTNEPQISDYGRQVAEEFLRRFPALRYEWYSVRDESRFDVLDPETGLGMHLTPEDFYYCEETRHWVHNYFMYDLNGNGIPEIVVQHGSDISRWNAQTLYIYRNGSFEAERDIWLHIFYRCAQGEIFLYSGDLGHYSDLHGNFWAADMDENGLHFELPYADDGGWLENVNDALEQLPMASHPLRPGEPLFPIRPFRMSDITAP